jgi:hypothetical protein
MADIASLGSRGWIVGSEIDSAGIHPNLSRFHIGGSIPEFPFAGFV